MSRKSKSLIPSPLALAIGLSIVVYILALVFTKQDTEGFYPLQLLNFFQKGIWDLLAFAMQMMLILVLGNVLAISNPVENILNVVLKKIKSANSAIVITALVSVALAYFNWGLGLIFSALLARAIGENSKINNIKINYPLLVAAAYSGMMVWHGGLSGSAPLKVAEKGHFLESKIGVVSVSETIFSSMNITLFCIFIIGIPLLYFVLGKLKYSDNNFNIQLSSQKDKSNKREKRKYLGVFFGIMILIMVGYQLLVNGLAALNINLINLMLFAMVFVVYPNLSSLMKSINSAISTSSGIMIQFPIYAGIMGLLKYSGLITIFTNQLVAMSTVHSFPIYSFISAAIVNFFVPSGGGQWAIQGPILIDAAQSLGVSIPKTIMALAYGDQITNMIQPFWAIPLLSITGVKAKQILPYTLAIMILGIIASIFVLLVF